MKDNFNDIDLCQLTAPVSKTATFNSSAVDTDVFNSITVCFDFGAASSDTLSAALKWACKIQESDDNSTFTDVAAGEIIDGNTTAANLVTVDANGELSKIYKLGYIGNARYVRGVVTATGSHVYGNVIGVFAMCGHRRMGPGSQASVAAG